jgi:uncharacterized NAD(P)/FAD-binding protein YdhS
MELSGVLPARGAGAAGGRLVAIIGAGFSGTLLALHLLERGPENLTILLIERAPGFGRGLAYGTRDSNHLLNVRVGNMSAFADRPRHLEQWLAERREGELAHSGAFITRRVYGDYLGSLIRGAVTRSPGAERLLLIHDEAVGLAQTPAGVRLTLAMGSQLMADAVVLAVGNLPPSPPRGLDVSALSQRAYAPDPWADGALDDLDDQAPVLLLGSGLTMVDLVLSLDGRGHRGPIAALSRRGLSPRRHDGLAPPAVEAPKVPHLPLSGLLSWHRDRVSRLGWREAVDALRPLTQSQWAEMSDEKRRRFLRHLRPWWDVHRHRMAPQVADRIETLRAVGRLTIAAGRLLTVALQGEDVEVTWRPRGALRDEVFSFARVINCTGPGGDVGRAGPVVRRLIEGGLGRVDPLGLGLEVDGGCRLIRADGSSDPRLYAVGPITKGSFWEIVAVPDIRNQVAEVASHIVTTLESSAQSALTLA